MAKGNFHAHSAVLSLKELTQTGCLLGASLRRLLCYLVGQIVERLADLLEIIGEMSVLEQLEKLNSRRMHIEVAR